MSELLQVAEALTAAAAAGQVCTLATVVRTEGSTYRRIGARMVVLADGSHRGGVSAGCLEADVVLRAARVREAGKPALVTYDTRSADDLVWGLGMGCGGLMELLLEPVEPSCALSKAERFQAVAESRSKMVLATIIGPGDDRVEPGDQAILDERGILSGLSDLDASSRETIRRAAERVLATGSSAALRNTLGGHEVGIAYEVRVPAVRLCLCGAGPDVIPLLAAARRLGWQVTQMDHRPTLMAGEHWPAVERRVVSTTEEIPAAVGLVDCDAVVVMNHHYERDREYLWAWLRTAVPYVGMLGPRHRTEQMLAALETRGVKLDEATRHRIRAPVGLDLGAETPEEVALAIVAEIQAVHTARSGGFLRAHEGPIHGPSQEQASDVPSWATTR